MTKEKDQGTAQDKGRRTTLKALLTGSGVITLGALPSQWVRPVVDAVSLPAHAQTSPPSDTAPPNGFAFTIIARLRREPSWWERIIPTAHAGLPSSPELFLCIESTGEGTYEASLTSEGTSGTGSGNIGDDCVPLSCGLIEIALRVTAENDDGSFDFELYEADDCGGDPEETGTTNTPCNVQSSKECEPKIEF